MNKKPCNHNFPSYEPCPFCIDEHVFFPNPEYKGMSVKEMVTKMNEEERDMVNRPDHYMQGSIETIDGIQAALAPEEFHGYCKGNALKYIWRERHKGQKESLKKAIWYLNRAINL